MNILMMTNTYTPIVGGVERSIISFAEEFRKKGHKVLIVTLEFDNMPADEDHVVRVPAIRHFNGSDFSVRLPIPTDLDEILKKFKPDIVHAHHPFILGDTALRIANQYQIPIVFTHHTKYEDYTHYVPLNSPAMKKFVIQLTTGYAELVDHVIAPSRSIEELLRQRGVKTSIDVIPTGVHFKRFSEGDGSAFRQKNQIDKDDFVIGHVGRLAPEKNLDFLVKAVTVFLKEHPKAKFLLIGKGPSLEEVQKAFRQQGLEDRLMAPGVLKGQDLIDAYHAMDVFAFASKTETQGMVLLEAMAAGVPVVALNASGVNDVLDDQENGILVRQEEVNEFVDALRSIFQQEDRQRKKFKKKAFQKAKSLSMEKTASRLFYVYEELCKKDFVYYDIENSPWVKVLGRLKAEWELVANLSDAVGATIKDQFAGQDQEGWLQKIKRWLNNNEWSARIAGLPPSQGTAVSPGVVFIQIDGLALSQIKQAIKNGRMPFLQKLIKKEMHELYPFYAGLPSSTPAVQAELFYGVKSAVPSFSFLDQKTGEVFTMYNQNAVVAVEERLRKGHAGLLEEGSSYANIYSGGAQETHFCAVDLGWDRVWRKIRPVKIVLLAVIHIMSIVRTTLRLVVELVSSLLDFVHGLFLGENFFKELKFIPTRLAICILMRDLITFGAKIDIIRGLPVIHVNFAGYDEHAHRRGPDSKFAHWALRGIDSCIETLYKETLRSQRRSYDVWIYSDHGQEKIISYAEKHKAFVHKKAEEIFRDISLQEDYHRYIPERGIQLRRIDYLAPGLSPKEKVLSSEGRNFPPRDKLVVTAVGPVGHIYLPEALKDEAKDLFAARLVREAQIPLVLACVEDGSVYAWNERGKFHLPREAAPVFGERHPFLKEVAEDMIRLVSHASAGSFTICGFKPEGTSWSFPKETGAHGGPGIEEIKGFALLPSDILSVTRHKNYLRASNLRNMAFKFMKKPYRQEGPQPSLKRKDKLKSIRIMTYNVHGCKGMDGKVFPERIARVIARHDPDIVALQELDMNRLRSNGVDQPHVIARELEMSYHFHPTIVAEEGRYGNAVLSKFPIEVLAAEGLPGLKGKARLEPRGAIRVCVDINGDRLQVINTHLGLLKKERIKQAEALLGKKWAGGDGMENRIVLVGDFNSLPSSAACQRIKSKFRDAQEVLPGYRPRKTWAGHLPFGCIDHVFVGPGIKVKKVKVAATHLDKTASDHLPLIVDIEIEAKGSPKDEPANLVSTKA